MSSSLLVVDDDDSIRSVLQRTLPYEGFRVTTVADGQAAIQVLREHAVDCVILDVGLPGINGLEVCRRLRGAGNTIPIILVTAFDAVSDRVGGLEAGADDYLVKPFALEELVARVRALLRRSGAEPDGAVLRFADLVLEPYGATTWRSTPTSSRSTSCTCGASWRPAAAPGCSTRSGAPATCCASRDVAGPGGRVDPLGGQRTHRTGGRRWRRCRKARGGTSS
jgi:CheY-like chemotaxis protein